MSLAVAVLSAAIAGAAASPAASKEPPPVRCRPAPYIIADREAPLRKQTLQDAGGARACYLMTIRKKAAATLV